MKYKLSDNKEINNASWIIGCKIARSVLALLISMITARYLGPSNYGLINYASSLTSFFAPIMYLGFNSILVQEFVVGKKNDGQILGTAMFCSMCSALCCIIGIAALVSITNPGETETLIVCVLYSVLLVFQAIDLVQYWFQAKLLSKYSSVIMLVAYVVVSIYKIILLVTQKSVYWFAISSALEYMVIAFVLLFFYRKLGGQRLEFSSSIAKRLIRKGKHFILANLMTMIYTETGRIMLKNISGDEATGFYTAATTCALVTQFVFGAIIDSARPSILAASNVDKKLFEKKIINLFSIIFYLSIVQCIVMTLLAEPIIYILYGEQYLEAIPVLRIVVWYTVFSYIGAVRGIWILGTDSQKYLLPITVAGAITNVILNIILIPQLGAVGAAYSSVISNFVASVVMNGIIKEIRPCNKLLRASLSIKNLLKCVKEFIGN